MHFSLLSDPLLLLKAISVPWLESNAARPKSDILPVLNRCFEAVGVASKGVGLVGETTLTNRRKKSPKAKDANEDKENTLNDDTKGFIRNELTLKKDDSYYQQFVDSKEIIVTAFPAVSLV